MDNTPKVYTFDEHFVGLFNVPFIVRKTPASPIEFNSKLSLVSVLGVSILLLTFIVIIFENRFEGVTELSECGAGTVGCILVFYREWAFIAKKTKITRLLRNLDTIFPLKYDDQKTYRLRIHSRAVIKQNRTMTFLITCISSLLILMPLFKSIYYWTSTYGEYQFLYPFFSWNPFGSSFISYAVIYCFLAATLLGGAYIWLKDDVLISTTVAQLCMHYRYLGEELSKLDARCEDETYPKLARLIRYQYNLDSMCNEINEIYSFSNLFNFTIVRIYACMYLFLLINSNDFIKVPTFAMAILALTLSVYLRCSVGMKLLDASSNLLYSIYDQNWYEGTIKYRKTILIMMMKANKPMKLQAFKLKTLSMEYFKEIIVSTYEIFMFLYNFTK